MNHYKRQIFTETECKIQLEKLEDGWVVADSPVAHDCDIYTLRTHDLYEPLMKKFDDDQELFRLTVPHSSSPLSLLRVRGRRAIGSVDAGHHFVTYVCYSGTAHVHTVEESHTLPTGWALTLPMDEFNELAGIGGPVIGYVFTTSGFNDVYLRRAYADVMRAQEIVAESDAFPDNYSLGSINNSPVVLLSRALYNISQSGDLSLWPNKFNVK